MGKALLLILRALVAKYGAEFLHQKIQELTGYPPGPPDHHLAEKLERVADEGHLTPVDRAQIDITDWDEDRDGFIWDQPTCGGKRNADD